MAETTHVQVRDARDRLIDLLGFAQTFPLRDLEVRDDQLTVPFNTRAIVPISYSQKDVRYQLRDTDDKVVRRISGNTTRPVQAYGNSAELGLETPLVGEDVTYGIRARKRGSGLEAYLHQKATVKVGLDVFLSAKILIDELLDPTVEVVTDTDARVVTYGTEVDVVVRNSQEGGLRMVGRFK